MTKKFIRKEWGSTGLIGYVEGKYHAYVAPTIDLLDLFQSFEERIEENINKIKYQTETDAIESECVGKLIERLIKLEEKMVDLQTENKSLRNDVNYLKGKEFARHEPSQSSDETLKVGWVYYNRENQQILIIRRDENKKDIQGKKTLYPLVGIFFPEGNGLGCYTTEGQISCDRKTSGDLIHSTGKPWKPEND